MRTCTKCQVSKEESSFNYRNKSKGTLASHCRKCSDDYNFDTCQCGTRKRIISELCQNCRNIQKSEDSNYITLTLGDKTYIKHKYAKYAYIRYYARKIGLELGFKNCFNCGYSKHFEICHIKSISSFTKDTLLTVINSADNIIPLCPNCHHEFDNGKLTIEDIRANSPD